MNFKPVKNLRDSFFCPTIFKHTITTCVINLASLVALNIIYTFIQLVNVENSNTYRFEDVKTILSRADNYARKLGMPVQFFNVFLTLEKQEIIYDDHRSYNHHHCHQNYKHRNYHYYHNQQPTICINSNCGGTSTGLPCCPSSSLSTARSHRVIWLSDPEAAKTELSVGDHSTDVIASVWCLNTATESPLWQMTKTRHIT